MLRRAASRIQANAANHPKHNQRWAVRSESLEEIRQAVRNKTDGFFREPVTAKS
jgi:hypothetical protein